MHYPTNYYRPPTTNHAKFTFYHSPRHTSISPQPLQSWQHNNIPEQTQSNIATLSCNTQHTYKTQHHHRVHPPIHQTLQSNKLSRNYQLLNSNVIQNTLTKHENNNSVPEWKRFMLDMKTFTKPTTCHTKVQRITTISPKKTAASNPQLQMHPSSYPTKSMNCHHAKSKLKNLGGKPIQPKETQNSITSNAQLQHKNICKHNTYRPTYTQQKNKCKHYHRPLKIKTMTHMQPSGTNTCTTTPAPCNQSQECGQCYKPIDLGNTFPSTRNQHTTHNTSEITMHGTPKSSALHHVNPLQSPTQQHTTKQLTHNIHVTNLQHHTQPLYLSKPSIQGNTNTIIKIHNIQVSKTQIQHVTQTAPTNSRLTRLGVLQSERKTHPNEFESLEHPTKIHINQPNAESTHAQTHVFIKTQHSRQHKYNHQNPTTSKYLKHKSSTRRRHTRKFPPIHLGVHQPNRKLTPRIREPRTLHQNSHKSAQFQTVTQFTIQQNHPKSPNSQQICPNTHHRPRANPPTGTQKPWLCVEPKHIPTLMPKRQNLKPSNKFSGFHTGHPTTQALSQYPKGSNHLRVSEAYYQHVPPNPTYTQQTQKSITTGITPNETHKSINPNLPKLHSHHTTVTQSNHIRKTQTESILYELITHRSSINYLTKVHTIIRNTTTLNTTQVQRQITTVNLLKLPTPKLYTQIPNL
eukprot:gene3062-2044_t